MMGEPVMIAYAPCISCWVVFSFDPDLVTSTLVHPDTRCPIRPDGTHIKRGDDDAVREPLCDHCARRHRAAGGRSRLIVELFPHARLDLIDLDAAARNEAAL